MVKAAEKSDALKTSTQQEKGLKPVEARQQDLLVKFGLLVKKGKEIERNMRDSLKADTQKRKGVVPLDSRQDGLLVRLAPR